MYGITKEEFQFPTGWNSTLTLNIILKSSGCFNSQRDGILHKFGGRKILVKIVSIPNGMEFYYDFEIIIYALQAVSIPNGMEFYSTNFAIFPSRKC